MAKVLGNAPLFTRPLGDPKVGTAHAARLVGGKKEPFPVWRYGRVHEIEIRRAEGQFFHVLPAVAAAILGVEKLQAVSIQLIENVVVPGEKNLRAIGGHRGVAHVLVDFAEFGRKLLGF